jgi:hypothetical protein
MKIEIKILEEKINNLLLESKFSKKDSKVIS